MVYKSGKMKGELTTTEIRKLIRAHNVLMNIKIPAGSKREDIIKIVEKNKYKIDHEAGALVPTSEMKRKPKVDLKKADSVLPKPKSKEEKATAKAERDKKKSAKEKELKQEGFKAGASLQRAVSKRQARKKKKPEVTEEEEVEEEETLTIEDKSKPVIKIKKALRTRLNKDFKNKYKKSIYQVLGFGTQKKAEADPKTPAEIKKICRDLKRKNHPDKGGDEEVFKSIQEACDIMIDTFK